MPSKPLRKDGQDHRRRCNLFRHSRFLFHQNVKLVSVVGDDFPNLHDRPVPQKRHVHRRPPGQAGLQDVLLVRPVPRGHEHPRHARHPVERAPRLRPGHSRFLPGLRVPHAQQPHAPTAEESHRAHAHPPQAGRHGHDELLDGNAVGRAHGNHPTRRCPHRQRQRSPAAHQRILAREGRAEDPPDGARVT